MKNIFLILISVISLTTYSTACFAESHHKTYKTKKYKHKHGLGLKRDKKKHEEFKKKVHKLQLESDLPVPASFDLTAKVSPPENQGSCGSCWDFSITKALRSAMMLASNDPGVLSFNYLLNNCGGVANESGCNGGDFDAGQNMLASKGPWLESQDPYQQRRTRCMNLPEKGTALTWNLVGDGNSAPSFKALSQAVSQNKMLSIDVAVCGEWGSYSEGIFNANQCGARSINHMINMVGYDCETSKDAAGNCLFKPNGEPQNGDGYLKVMNNWGNSWGENGYMRTRWGVDAVATTAMYFEVVQPVPPVPPPVPPVPPVPPIPGTDLPLWAIILISVLGIGVIILAVVALTRGKSSTKI